MDYVAGSKVKTRISASPSTLFRLWHVFHTPFVSVMLAIAALHVAVGLYFGYAERW